MKLLQIIAATVIASTILMAAESERTSPLYEMRVYYAPPGKLSDLHARFRDHTTRLFEKHGMTNVGYWVPAGENPDNKLIYVLAYRNREARDKSWKAFMADPDWQKAWKESEKNGPIVIGNRMESTFMTLTDYSPKPKIEKRGGRVFELRTYTTPEGKLDDLNARFRNHTVKLFKKHGMENVAYWNMTPAQKRAETTLIYILAHKSPEAQAVSFDAFRKDPDWIKARDESQKEGSLTVRDGVKSVIMVPTDYSPMK
jgi:hypothetical protein